MLCVTLAAALLCNAEYLAIALSNGSMNKTGVFSVKNGKHVCLSSTEDGTRLAIGDEERVWILQLTSPTIKKLHSIDLKGVWCVALSSKGDELAAGTDSIVVYELDNAMEKTKLKGHKGRTNQISFASNGTHLISCGLDGIVKDWDLRNRSETRLVEYPNSPVVALAVAPHSALIAASAMNGKLMVLDVRTNKSSRNLGQPLNVSRAVSFSPKGRLFAASFCEFVETLDPLRSDSTSEIGIFNVTDLKKRISLPGHRAWINSICFSPDENFIVSGSSDKTVRVWSVSDRKEIARGEHGDWVTAVLWLPGGTIVSAGLDGKIIFWSLGRVEKSS
jgi:WD40 repeat protein